MQRLDDGWRKSKYGKLDLIGLGALHRLPSGLVGRSDILSLRLDGTAISDVSELVRMTSLVKLSLAKTQIADIAPVAAMTSLKRLQLNETKVADITPVAGLMKLAQLYLRGTEVADISPLAGLMALEVLLLSETKVTDVAPLARLSALRQLYLQQTQVRRISFSAGQKIEHLRLDETAASDIAPIAELTHLEHLRLDQTAVSDIAPIAGLTKLKFLALGSTSVADLTPLSGLTALQRLDISMAQVSDLLPLASVTGLRSTLDRPPRLRFFGSPAAARDKAHKYLSSLALERCAFETLQFLNGQHPTLGGPPAPWRPAPQPLPDPYDFAAQNPAGWQFELRGTMLAIETRATPSAAAERLLPRLRVRLDELSDAFAGVNQGTAQLIKKDAEQMAEVVKHGIDTITDKALVLWELSVALGHHLEQDRQAAADGRHQLDRLTAERAGALARLLSVSAVFVRLFPEARELDDATGAFLRTAFHHQRTLDLTAQAVSVRVLEHASGDLIKGLVEIAAQEGIQAAKARSVTITGERNMLGIVAHYGRQTAILLGVGAVAGSVYVADGIAQGALEKVGSDLADEWQLGLHAAHLIKKAHRELSEMVHELPADLAGALQEAISAVDAADLPPLSPPRPVAPISAPKPPDRR